MWMVFLQEDSVRGRDEARPRGVRGAAEPGIGRAPRVAFPSQVHQRARTGRQSSPGGSADGGQSGEGEEGSQRDQELAAIAVAFR